MFFRRLEIYTEVPATVEMMDIIVQKMVEVLYIRNSDEGDRTGPNE